MVATGREPTLPPDLTSDTGPAPAAEDTPEYVETIRQRLQLTHQQMAAPPAAPSPNPHPEGSLVYVLTTPPERTSKLAPRWKGPFRICRIPNDYQVTYEGDGVERTVPINHVKPTKFAAPDLPEPVPPDESTRPPLGYLPAGFAHKPTKPPNLPAAPFEAPMAPITPPAAPKVPTNTPPPVAPAVPPPEPAPPCRRSPRLHPEQGQAHAILSRPATRSPASQPQSKPRPHAVNSSSRQCSRMARVHPLTVGYTEALGPKSNPLSFTSLRLVDLYNGHSQYFNTLQKLADALPKTKDPATRFALRGHLAHPGQHRLRRSMRAAIWFLLPSDGAFIRDSSSLHYYLARQGWRVILRGGDVTRQPWENKLNWIPDSVLATSRDHGIVNSALSPEAERREKARTENQENEAPLSDSADPGANWMQDPRRDQCKEKSPLGQPTSQNSPLCNPPKRRRGLRSRHKEKSPLRGANWPHRKSHPGANQINYAADLGPPTLPSHPATRTAPWNPDTPRRPYKRAGRSRVKQFSKRPRREHFSEIPLPPEAR